MQGTNISIIQTVRKVPVLLYHQSLNAVWPIRFKDLKWNIFF